MKKGVEEHEIVYMLAMKKRAQGVHSPAMKKGVEEHELVHSPAGG